MLALIKENSFNFGRITALQYQLCKTQLSQNYPPGSFALNKVVISTTKEKMKKKKIEMFTLFCNVKFECRSSGILMFRYSVMVKNYIFKFIFCFLCEGRREEEKGTVCTVFGNDERP